MKVQSGNIFFVVCICLLMCGLAAAQVQTLSGPVPRKKMTEASTQTVSPRGYGEDLVYGLEAYKKNDWSNALFFLRKAAGVAETASEEVWLLMILSEMNVHDYQAVLRDRDIFVRRFSASHYVPNVEYQGCLALFALERYEQAVQGFTAFCERYPEHALTGEALFWTAESFYRQYEYARALSLYQRVVDGYENSEKYTESVYRIELLKQREREEKLLYLLRVTAEEAAAAREEYERRAKTVQSEQAADLKQTVQNLEEHIEALQKAYDEEHVRNSALNTRIRDLLTASEAAAHTSETAAGAKGGVSDKLLNELKQKARELETMIRPQEGF